MRNALEQTGTGAFKFPPLPRNKIYNPIIVPELPENPELVVVGIGCGSLFLSHLNDAGFWIFCKLSNMTEKEALRTVSPQLVVMGLTGLIVIIIGAKFFPLV
jgi:H+/gluconate symporter-like permease